MAETWATSGVDLHLDTGGRVRGAVESALRDAVRTGRLEVGVRLPSSRSLAGDLGVARNTVAAAYAQLVAEGWLEARHGSGTWVAARPVPLENNEASPGLAPQARYDLRPGFPDLAAFPVSQWLASTRRALHAASFDALGYGDPRGRLELRRALAVYLARARGAHVPPDRIVVCSGFAQGLALVCRALGGGRFATEAFGHRSHRATILASGLETSALTVDDAGARIDELAGERAVLLTPAHQFPLGPTLAAPRRIRAVEWARETGGVIVEDDYDGEFRYDRQPLGALQALAPERVIYAGTASKSLAPALRLGWLVVPEDLLERVLAARQLTDGPGAIDQLALADLIQTSAYDRQVRRMRLVYRRRRDKLVRTLGPERVRGIDAGLHLVVDVPDERAAVASARSRGVGVEGLTEYRLGAQPHAPALVVGYGTPPEHAFSTGVARLKAALEN